MPYLFSTNECSKICSLHLADCTFWKSRANEMESYFLCTFYWSTKVNQQVPWPLLLRVHLYHCTAHWYIFYNFKGKSIEMDFWKTQVNFVNLNFSNKFMMIDKMSKFNFKKQTGINMNEMHLRALQSQPLPVPLCARMIALLRFPAEISKMNFYFAI